MTEVAPIPNDSTKLSGLTFALKVPWISLKDSDAPDTSNECHDPLSVNEITADLVISIARKVKRDLKRTHTRDDANCAENKDEEKGKGEAQQPIHDRKRRKKDDMKEEVKTNHVQQNVSVHDIVGGVCRGVIVGVIVFSVSLFFYPDFQIANSWTE